MSTKDNAERSGDLRSRGFTLLEVMLAVVVMAMLVITLYSFVEANLRAITFSKEMNAEHQAMTSLVSYIQEQLGDLPPRGQGVLLGTAHKYRDLASDEMEWVCSGGSGVLTTAAPEQYRVVLTIQPVEKNSTALEIGLRRRPIDADEKNYKWVPLLKNVVAMEIRYHDPRQQNQWLEKWRDPNARPSLVRVKIWRTAEDQPFEAVLNVPAANVQG
jgi:prepilin-type N-terminal cleavage/methylation domain-containing protein